MDKAYLRYRETKGTDENPPTQVLLSVHKSKPNVEDVKTDTVFEYTVAQDVDEDFFVSFE